jgi:hypothetical protein
VRKWRARIDGDALRDTKRCLSLTQGTSVVSFWRAKKKKFAWVTATPHVFQRIVNQFPPEMKFLFEAALNSGSEQGHNVIQRFNNK